VRLQLRVTYINNVTAMSDNLKDEGRKDKVEGKLREGVGKITDDKEEEARGKMQQAKGEVKKQVGEITDDE
jgi:uncharacterized protein YjbJ (UPF0337 family)